MSANGDTHAEMQGGNYDDPKASSIAMFGFVGTLVLVVTMVALQALYYREETIEIARKTAETPAMPQELRQLCDQQLAALNSYHWVDKSKGVVGLPIQRAMETTWKELAASQPARP